MAQKAFLPPMMFKQVITKPAHAIDVDDYFAATDTQGKHTQNTHPTPS